MKNKKYITTNFLNFLSESNEDNKLNKNFINWFGDSKIVDNSGNPIILHHGTNSKILNFEDSKKGSSTDPGLRGRGFYFTSNIKSAKSYGENIYDVYLKIENPLDLLSFNSLQDIIELLDIDPSIIYERNRGTKLHSISISLPFSGVFSSRVRDKGFDGIIHGQEFIVFSPNQIKSINNDGSYDNDDFNIFS